MRVPGIGSFSPVEGVSWVRASSPSELAYRDKARAAVGGASPVGGSNAAVVSEARAQLSDAVTKLHQTSETASSRGTRPAGDVRQIGPDDTITDAYPGVRGGTITVNGHSISVTAGVTTLRQVVAALDTIPGLFAAVDSGTGTIVVAGLMADKKLVINDSTGLLKALGLQTNVVAPTPDAEPQAASSPEGRANEVSQVFGHVNDAMRKLAEAPRDLDALRVAANGAVASAIGSLDPATAKAFQIDAKNGVLNVTVDKDRLSSALKDNPKAIDSLLGENLAKPLQTALEQFDDATAATRLVSPSTQAAKPTRPPVEMFESILDHAGFHGR